MDQQQWDKLLAEKYYITSHEAWEEVKIKLEENGKDTTIIEGRYRSIGGRARYEKWLKEWQKQLDLKWSLEYDAFHKELTFDEAMHEREKMELYGYCTWLSYI